MSARLEAEIAAVYLFAAIRNAGEAAVRRQPRWAHVRDLFCVGKTTSHELCQLANVDPDEMVSGKIRCGCGEHVAPDDLAAVLCQECEGAE